MSFFKKALSKVGIGAAKVDAVLDESSLAPGDELTGTIKITGGKVEQPIRKITLGIFCNYFAEVEGEREDSDGHNEEYTRIVEKTALLYKVDRDESFTIQPSEKLEIPFQITLPINTPLSAGHTKIWLDTNLDIEFSVDKSDKDYVTVYTTEYQEAVIKALENFGFELHDAKCEEAKRYSPPFVQEFEFKPRGGEFRRTIDEVEVIFDNHGDRLVVALEVDRRARGVKGFFAEMFDMDEHHTRVVIDESNIGDIDNILYDLLSRHS